ncbi:MAG: carbohydrate binding family 9 domain-containing protein [bacterium]|nr:carbohydrate binding family 9 domain-containing protein [bacterium]
MTGKRITIAGALILLALSWTSRAWSQAPTLELLRINTGEEPEIDGNLEDPVWEKATWFADFRQSVPHFEAPATEPTNVAFLLDDLYVYVAVRCDDSAPELIRAQKLRHRDNPSNDDHIQLIFDTYMDQIRGTIFVVNPLGAKEEGLVNGYHRYTWSWDEVWRVETQITDKGWQAEFRIPVRLLRYSGAAEQSWGINVKRVVRRKQEETYISPPAPPYDISSLNFAATLTGVKLGKRPRNLQFIPYVLGGALQESSSDTDEDENSTVSEFGFDVKYSLTSDLTLDATYNTDFAQVEADDEQVNLTRFSLFYPEKREFFLENSELFTFGHGGGPPGHGPEVTPFFSRRIGLQDDETVPINAGVRLTGKVGKQDIGVLTTLTGAVDDLDLPSAWYNVARIRRDLGGRSYVGGIVTASQRDTFRSTTFGVDGAWFITSDLSLRGDYLRVDANHTDDAQDAYNVALDLTTDPWGFLFSFREVDQDFEPDLGFVQREGYQKKQAVLRRSFRPEKWGVRRVSFRTFNNWYDSLEHGVQESARNNLNFELELENGDKLQGGVTRQFERLFEPFELDDELIFDAGDYSFVSYDVKYDSDRSRRWGFNGSATNGGFFDGDRSQLSGELWYVFNSHFRVSGSYSKYDIDTNHGDLDWHIWSARLSYTHSSTLSASSYVQFNSSTGARTLNLRLRWILRNDSNLFLVYNDRDEEPVIGPSLQAREIALKVNYRFFL